MAAKKTKQADVGTKQKAGTAKPVSGGEKKRAASLVGAKAKSKPAAKPVKPGKVEAKPSPARKATPAAKKTTAKKAPASGAAGKKAAKGSSKAVSKKAPAASGRAKPAGKASEAPLPAVAREPVRPSPTAVRKAKEKVSSKSPFSHTDHADVFRGVEARKAAARAKQARLVKVQKVARKTSTRRLTDKQLDGFEQMLQRIRAELLRQIAYLRGVSLTRSDEVNPEEDGTDAFERQLALKLAAGEGDSIFEIDEALERIREKTYGVCEECGCLIPVQRLKALPFARRCVECQSRVELTPSTSEHRYF